MHPKTRKALDLAVAVIYIGLGVIFTVWPGLLVGCIPDSKSVGLDSTELAFKRTVAIQQQAAADVRGAGLMFIDHAFQRAEETGLVVIDHFFDRAQQWQDANIERLRDEVTSPAIWRPIVGAVVVLALICLLIWLMYPKT